MATPTADTYTAASGAVIHAGRNAVVSPPLPPIPAAGAYRTTQQRLFADVLADTVVADEDIGGSLLRSTPARAGVSAPAQGYLWSAHGPHRSYVDLRGGWPWVNAGGDWINASGTPQATSSPHFEFAANAATTGSAQYSVTVTAGAQAAQTGDRWHAYIVTGSARALVGLHHDTLPAPSVAVSYTDGSTATLQCVACVGMPAGTSYTQTGRQEHPVNPTVALEFERPPKAVASAVMTITVAQHTSTPSTLRGYLANPPVTTNTVVQGLAAGYQGDAGLAAHASVLVSHRYQDGSTIGDWIALPTASIGVFTRSNWDQEVLGLGAADTTKLPTAHLGTALAGKWFHKQYFPGSISLVASTHTADNFQPLAPGLGALRVVTPKSTAADGAVVPAATGSDLWMLFPKSVSGTDALKRTFVRFYFRFTSSAKRLADTKLFRSAAGGIAEYGVQKGKWGVGVHHWTSRGGNNRTGGDGLGWSNRLVYEQQPTDMPVSGLLHGIHSLDMFNGATTAPAGNVGGNLPFGKAGGRGASVYPDRWYCLEVECDLNTWDAGGDSPYDGVQRAWLDGVLVAEWTGVRYRNGPLDPAGAGTDLPPCRQLGPIGLALNEYMGGVLPSDEDRVCFYAAIACGTSYIGPMVQAADPARPWLSQTALTLPTLPASMTIGTLGTSTFGSLFPASTELAFRAAKLMDAWGSASTIALYNSTGQLADVHYVMHGGGHGDSGVNGAYYWSLRDQAWYTAQASTADAAQAPPGDPTLLAWGEDSPLRPASTHAYQHFFAADSDAATGPAFHRGYAGGCWSSAVAVNATHRMDWAAKTWARVATLSASASTVHLGIKDRARGRYVRWPVAANRRDYFVYDYGSATPTVQALNQTNFRGAWGWSDEHFPCGVHHEALDLYIAAQFQSSTNKLMALPAGNLVGDWTALTTTGATIPAMSGVGLQYRSAAGTLLLVDASTTPPTGVFELTPPSSSPLTNPWTVVRHAFTGSSVFGRAPDGKPTQIADRFQYVAALDALIVCPTDTAPVEVWRM